MILPPLLLAVTGKPVLHSKSPPIMNAALAHVGLPGRYIRLAADSAAEALSLMRLLGIRGLNVTAPFKRDMLPLLCAVDEGARTIGGANTILHLGDGRFAGWNTDDRGVVASFADYGVQLAGRRVLLVGAGGAARGAVYGLTRAGAQVTIVNRTYEKAAELARQFGCRAVPLASLKAQVERNDALVSTVSPQVALVDPDWLRPGQTVFDANYKGSPLSEAAGERGCTVIRGLDWLINQAIPSFERFADGATCPRRVMEDALAGVRQGRPERIALIGFMGCGKTRNGRKLAKRLAWRFQDMDAIIEDAAGCDIARIFQTRGEKAFRTLETQTLERLAHTSETVVSCGGGVVTQAANRRLLNDHFLCVWLVASSDTVRSRTGGDTRPLLAGDNPRERIESLFAERRMLYAECADLTVATEPDFRREAHEKIHEEYCRTFLD